MELRTASSPRDVKTYDTQRLREEFLIDDLFRADDIKLVYSHIDRIITGSAVPVKGTLGLTAGEELRAQYFLERRELGVINIGGEGTVTVDGTVYTLRHRDGLYVGRGSKDIVFASKDAANPAKFYLNSCPAHTAGAGQPGNGESPHDLQVHSAGAGAVLPAGDGHDEAGAGVCVEHDALPYPRPPHGGLPLFRHAGGRVRDALHG